MALLQHINVLLECSKRELSKDSMIAQWDPKSKERACLQLLVHAQKSWFVLLHSIGLSLSDGGTRCNRVGTSMHNIYDRQIPYLFC